MLKNIGVTTKRFLKSSSAQDQLMNQKDASNRRKSLEDNLRKAQNATKLFQRYKNSAEQFRMTFSEYKRLHRHS